MGDKGKKLKVWEKETGSKKGTGSFQGYESKHVYNKVKVKKSR